MGHVKGYTKKLKSGKICKVKGYAKKGKTKKSK